MGTDEREVRTPQEATKGNTEIRRSEKGVGRRVGFERWGKNAILVQYGVKEHGFILGGDSHVSRRGTNWGRGRGTTRETLGEKINNNNF